MNAIDEWLNSDAAKRDALKFKNGCYIISGMRCGKTQMMKDLYERLGIDIQKTPNIRCLRQKFDDVDATNAIKEFINKQYGVNSFGRAVHDDSLDALRHYIWPNIFLPTAENIREEFMMDLLHEGYVRVMDHGLGDYDVIDMYVRVFVNGVKGKEYVKFNFYRRSSMDPIYTVKFTNPTFSWNERDVCDICREVTNDKLIWQLFVQQNRNFLAACERKYSALVKRMPNKSAAIGLMGRFIKSDISSDWIYCITDYWLHTEYDGCNKRTKAHFHAFQKPKNMSMELWGRIVKRYSKEHIRDMYGVEESTMYYYEYDDGRIEIPCYELVENSTDCPHKVWNASVFDGDVLKKEEETKKMDINVLKGAFNSKLYMIKNGSEDLSYLGTVMGMSIDRALGCELTGKIEFVADDEPVKKLQYFNREFIKNVVFNDPATIVEWKDGTKTVVQVRDGEKFDPEKGLAMAIAKKAMGNKRDYYHVFKHYLKKAEKASKKSLKAIDLKDFKEDSENDLVTFKCCKADYEKIRKMIIGFNSYILNNGTSNDAHIIPDTIDVEEAERYKEDK